MPGRHDTFNQISLKQKGQRAGSILKSRNLERFIFDLSVLILFIIIDIASVYFLYNAISLHEDGLPRFARNDVLAVRHCEESSTWQSMRFFDNYMS